ncbi:RNA polymerase sigma factor [Oceanobacillus sp. J11TS1]|uniref:RNA polymerase sigma factor n=1 Tax=Oceanobacillus sp. J11TS1 TaxID=2807191 RepID=UPI001B03EA69|nr:sigma-70 family RNA polymerase sigma factor [Oceanobacillus sp. J11TS1]GIO23420.1 hypothetical protein J11TS1_20010 [Oceanobacillus sp. J11TS1]
MTKKKWELEDFIEQNQRRVYYQLNRLKIQDREGDYFQEGLVAMWRAYEKHNPDKGPLATYMNYQIRNRLVDIIRKSSVERKYLDQLIYQRKVETQSGNYLDGNQIPEMQGEGNPLETVDHLDASSLSEFTAALTDKQKIWFCDAIIDGLTNPEIAEKEQVSLEAVKSWAKGAKRKLRKLNWDRT